MIKIYIETFIKNIPIEEVSGMNRTTDIGRTNRERHRPADWNNVWDMENAIRDFFFRPLSRRVEADLEMPGIVGDFAPEVDLAENETELRMSVAVPGMEKDDITVDTTEHSVTVSGKREDRHEDENKLMCQQSYGSFSVSYRLPEAIRTDDVSATYKDGMLEITMPKAHEKESHKIN